MNLNFCQGCGITEHAPVIENQFGIFCSDDCYDLKLKRLGRKRPHIKTCLVCETEFETARDSGKYCSSECRQEGSKAIVAERVKAKFAALYPGGIKHKTCRWCNEPMEVSAKKSYAGRLYHPDCSKEAERARYRIKTVKRQSKLVKPSRLAADEVVRTYGANCHICELPIDPSLPRTSKQGLTVDHLIPLSKGGSDTIENLRPAHWSCNRKKSDKLPEELNA
jgi:5-methylcytosine-specific restriction endonuclease McrA